MIKLSGLIRSCEEIIGYPYESPGTNDERGIDCSGMFVRAFRAQNASIYHGSNRIIRAHCRGVIQLTSAAQLVPGMAVFKRRDDGAEPVEYKPGGKYYDAALVGNYYHIGLVCSTNPLRIVHATPPVAKVDTALASTKGTPGWSWAGYLIDVDYGTTKEDATMTTPKTEYAVAYAAQGTTVNMRDKPNGEYMLKIPIGTRLPIHAGSNGWSQTTYNGHIGWVKDEYLQVEGTTPVPSVETIPSEEVVAAYKLLGKALGVE